MNRCDAYLFISDYFCFVKNLLAEQNHISQEVMLFEERVSGLCFR